MSPVGLKQKKIPEVANSRMHAKRCVGATRLNFLILFLHSTFPFPRSYTLTTHLAGMNGIILENRTTNERFFHQKLSYEEFHSHSNSTHITRELIENRRNLIGKLK